MKDISGMVYLSNRDIFKQKIESLSDRKLESLLPHTIYTKKNKRYWLGEQYSEEGYVCFGYRGLRGKSIRTYPKSPVVRDIDGRIQGSIVDIAMWLYDKGIMRESHLYK